MKLFILIFSVLLCSAYNYLICPSLSSFSLSLWHCLLSQYWFSSLSFAFSSHFPSRLIHYLLIPSLFFSLSLFPPPPSSPASFPSFLSCFLFGHILQHHLTASAGKPNAVRAAELCCWSLWGREGEGKGKPTEKPCAPTALGSIRMPVHPLLRHSIFY